MKKGYEAEIDHNKITVRTELSSRYCIINYTFSRAPRQTGKARLHRRFQSQGE